jgi:hypothetical protein
MLQQASTMPYPTPQQAKVAAARVKPGMLMHEVTAIMGPPFSYHVRGIGFVTTYYAVGQEGILIVEADVSGKVLAVEWNRSTTLPEEERDRNGNGASENTKSG